MKTASLAFAFAVLLPALAAHAQAGARPDRAFVPAGEAAAIADFGPPATEAQGRQAVEALVAKWGGVMRRIKGWDESAIAQFKEGHRRLPARVLDDALAERDFDGMLATFSGYAAASAQRSMARAFPLNRLEPQHADDPRVAEAAQLAAKVLGDNANDLVFIPVTPCTVWDTRFATEPASAGLIASGVTKRFYTHFDGDGGSYAPWGGNPSCPETAVNAIGNRPYAVMMTVFTNDATGNGWVTVYRDGDADPSQATISVYYATGPTKTQTVISKSNRGYGTGTYDVAVTSRFASVHVAAVVTGYFIKPQATPLQCTTTTGIAIPVAAGATRFWNSQDVTCPSGYIPTGCLHFWNSGNVVPLVQPLIVVSGCAFDITNNGSVALSFTPVARCCRVPGR